MYFFLACDCNPDGAVNHLCDDYGKCTCNEHVVGDKCDSCATGYGDFFACDQCIDEYHGYPNCIGKICNTLLLCEIWCAKYINNSY